MHYVCQPARDAAGSEFFSLLHLELNGSCTPPSRFGWRIAKTEHMRILAEQGMNNSSLCACPTAMNDPYFRQPFVVALVQILFNSSPDISRGKRVKIQTVLNWDDYKFIAF
jgi:hypothetical protein